PRGQGVKGQGLERRAAATPATSCPGPSPDPKNLPLRFLTLGPLTPRLLDPSEPHVAATLTQIELDLDVDGQRVVVGGCVCQRAVDALCLAHTFCGSEARKGVVDAYLVVLPAWTERC